MPPRAPVGCRWRRERRCDAWRRRCATSRGLRRSHAPVTSRQPCTARKAFAEVACRILRTCTHEAPGSPSGEMKSRLRQREQTCAGHSYSHRCLCRKRHSARAGSADGNGRVPAGRPIRSVRTARRESGRRGGPEAFASPGQAQRVRPHPSLRCATSPQRRAQPHACSILCAACCVAICCSAWRCSMLRIRMRATLCHPRQFVQPVCASDCLLVRP